jgi:hypothetical protein
MSDKELAVAGMKRYAARARRNSSYDYGSLGKVEYIEPDVDLGCFGDAVASLRELLGGWRLYR